MISWCLFFLSAFFDLPWLVTSGCFSSSRIAFCTHSTHLCILALKDRRAQNPSCDETNLKNPKIQHGTWNPVVVPHFTSLLSGKECERCHCPALCFQPSWAAQIKNKEQKIWTLFSSLLLDDYWFFLASFTSRARYQFLLSILMSLHCLWGILTNS